MAGGAALRWVHLGTASLWWDELVEIAMAQAGGVADVLRVTRHGVPPGSGNAGGMPLDYLVLHAWLAVAPTPSPEHLEIHFRLPAFVWSVAALVAFAGFARAHLGRDIGAIAILLLALSIPHVVYAAEVRWYSLLVLVTIGHLWAFARLLEAPALPGRWLAWLALAIVSLLTALLSAIPLAVELLVIAARTAGSRRALAAIVASGAVVALLAAWLAVPTLGVAYGRPDVARRDLLATTALVLRFLAWNDPLLLGAAALGAVFVCRRSIAETGPTRSLGVALVLSFVAIPIVTALADVKAYYVHPRHVIFLLPAFVVLAAAGLAGACRRIVGSRWALSAAVALVAGTQLPTAARYVASPDEFLGQTKPLRDVRGLMAALQGVPSSAQWLLLAQRESVANAILDRYLHWWGLADHVVFRGTRDVPQALRVLASPGEPLEQLAVPPLATIAVGLTGELRALLGIAADTSPPQGPFAGATLVAWEVPQSPPASGLVRRDLVGLELFRRSP